MNDGVLLRQKRLNMSFFAVWIMVITTCQWMMVDMYLPALPVLKEEFQCSESVLNWSLNSGIVMSAVGTLIGGMLSDKYGRKALVLLGMFITTASCYAAAASNGIVPLILFRGICGLGSGFILSITAAMIKDSFEGQRFERTMTILQSVAVVGPIIAPASGSILINFYSWRFIFIILGTVTLITAIPMIISTETLSKEDRIAGGFGNVFREMVLIASNKGFALFLGIMSFLTIPVWAYIAVSSYVYISEFGLSNMEYSVFYAFGSILSLVAPFVYMVLRKKLHTGRVVSISIALVVLGAVELFALGKITPVLFMIGVFALMLSEGIIRPLTMIVILEENPQAVGTASSLTQFLGNVVGVIGSTVATLAWQSMITGIAVVSIVSGILGIACWIGIIKGRLVKSLMKQ